MQNTTLSKVTRNSFKRHTLGHAHIRNVGASLPMQVLLCTSPMSFKC